MRNGRACFRAIGLLLFLEVTAEAAPTNTWQAVTGDGKWELFINWSAGVPSLNHGVHLIGPVGGNPANATVNAATVASNILNGCLTISNLTVRGTTGPLGQASTLSLNNAPGSTALVILSNLTIGTRGSVTITNSRLRVGSPFPVTLDGLYNNGSLLLNTGGELVTTDSWTNIGNAGAGQMTVLDGTWRPGYALVGNGGQGTLTLAGGATTINSYLSLGHYAGGPFSAVGTGTVWMTGGELVSTNTTFVSTVAIGGTSSVGNGVGNMTMSNGNWRASFVRVGGEGTLTIAGGTVTIISSSASSGGLVVGTDGLSQTGTVWVTGGQLTITNRNTVTYVGFASQYTDNRGQITISNGIWRARLVVVVPRDLDNPNPVTEVGGGTLTIAGGTSVISSNLTIGNNRCVGEDFVDAYVNISGGSLFVTNAAHDAELDLQGGTLTLSSGTLTVDKFVQTNFCAHFIRTGGTLVITTTNLTPNADTDLDGLPNYWEQQYGFDPFDPSTGLEDPDNDGLDNFAEYWLDTDPLDRTDPFRVTDITREGDNIRVKWDYVPPPGNSFDRWVVEASANVTGTWNAVSGTNTMPPQFFTIATTNHVETGGATNKPARFYRVRLVP